MSQPCPEHREHSTRLAARVLCAALLMLASASGALADTVRVTTDRALVWSDPSGVAVVVTQLLRNDTADVIRKIDGWYEIIVPTGALSGEIRTGFILASQVVVDSVAPPSDQVTRATTPAPRPRRAGTSFLHINGARREAPDNLTQVVSVASTDLGEDSAIAASYSSTTGWSFNLLAGGPVWRWVGIGWGIDYQQRDGAATVNALVPHPYFFDTPRPASFTTEPLRSREVAVHFPAMLIPPALGPVRVMVFAGPTVFRSTRTVVTDVALNEQFPYDRVAIGGVSIKERKVTSGGYHAGADISVFLTRSIGVGAGIRYSHSSFDRFEEDAATTRGEAGGMSTVGGLRFKF